MPTLAQAVKMKYPRVCKYLSKIPSSDYFGMTPKQVSSLINKNDANVYLNDLIITNDRLKANLYLVSEKSGESMSQIMASRNSQIEASPLNLLDSRNLQSEY